MITGPRIKPSKVGKPGVSMQRLGIDWDELREFNKWFAQDNPFEAYMGEARPHHVQPTAAHDPSSTQTPQ